LGPRAGASPNHGSAHAHVVILDGGGGGGGKGGGWLRKRDRGRWARRETGRIDGGGARWAAHWGLEVGADDVQGLGEGSGARGKLGHARGARGRIWHTFLPGRSTTRGGQLSPERKACDLFGPGVPRHGPGRRGDGGPGGGPFPPATARTTKGQGLPGPRWVLAGPRPKGPHPTEIGYKGGPGCGHWGGPYSKGAPHQQRRLSFLP